MTRRTFSHRIARLAKADGLPAQARKEAICEALRMWDGCAGADERGMLATILLKGAEPEAEGA